MITIQTQLSYDQLLEAASQLSPTELDNFQRQLAQLRARQQHAPLPEEEADLLIKINSVSTSTDPRYQELLSKRQTETLTESEHHELTILSDQYEQQNAERIKHLSELAKIRGTSLTDLMAQLEVSQPTYD